MSLRTARVAHLAAPLLFALGLGCGRSESSPRTPAAAPPEAPPTPPPVPDASPPAELPGTPVSVAEELALVERTRGLRAEHPVLGRVLSGAELSAHLDRVFSEQVPPHVLRGNEDALVLLEFAPLGFDYEKAIRVLLRVGLAGLYEPRLGVMFLRRELGEEARRYTLLHELTHALEDQAYGFSDFTHFQEGQSDRMAARSALAEGDAMLTMMAAATGRPLAELSVEAILRGPTDGLALTDEDAVEALRANPPPPFLARSLAAPYEDGVLFAKFLHERGGFAALDAAFERPPLSTEQLLHPAKYASAEAPLATKLPSEIAARLRESGFAPHYVDVLGEQTLRLVLREWFPRNEADRAAAGWGGDEFAVWTRGDESWLGWTLRMDSADELRELRELLERRVPRGCVDRGALGPLRVSEREGALLLAAGPYDRRSRAEAPLAPRFRCASMQGW